MARQRNGKQAVRNGGSAIPGWALFVSGVVLGVLVCLAVVYTGHLPSLRRNDQPQADPNAVAEHGSGPGIAAGSSASSATSKFDFYKVLPEKEVVIPKSDLSAMAKAEQHQAAAANDAGATAPAASAAATAHGGYVLQVQAYHDAKNADTMKAKLALHGFTAHVQSVTLDGEVWHRVRIGPFASALQLQAAQKKLAAAGIHSIPLKEK
jgi:cell division protein FtsN